MRGRAYTHKQPMIECTAYEDNAPLEEEIVSHDRAAAHPHNIRATTSASQIRNMTVG